MPGGPLLQNHTFPLVLGSVALLGLGFFSFPSSAVCDDHLDTCLTLEPVYRPKSIESTSTPSSKPYKYVQMPNRPALDFPSAILFPIAATVCFLFRLNMNTKVHMFIFFC